MRSDLLSLRPLHITDPLLITIKKRKPRSKIGFGTHLNNELKFKVNKISSIYGNIVFCRMNLKKPIKVRLLKEASDYFYKQNEKVQKKLLLAFDKTESGHKGDWFEKLKNTDGIYEFRQSDHQKFYRVFAFWDSDDKETLIVGTHGIDKKSNKTPPKEIKKAEQIKKKYFETKKNRK